MAEKDISEKMLLSYEDVFADIVNVLLFHGEQKVKSEDLEEMNTWEGYKAMEGLHYMERDVAKWWRVNNLRFACFGFENMTYIDNRMVFRVYGYDGAEYRAQCTDEGRKVPPYAVVTLVLHFSIKKRWEELAPTMLYETVYVPEELKQYVPNVKINVFDIAWLTPEQVSMFRSDFRFVAEYFVKKRLGQEYVGTTDEVKHIYEVLELLSVMENDDRLLQAYYSKSKEGKIHNMSEVLDRVEQRGAEKKEKEMKKLFAQKETKMKESFAQKETKMKESFAQKETEMKESFARKMLTIGRPRSEVAECSGLSLYEVMQIEKNIVAARA